MDLAKLPPQPGGEKSSPCSICLDLVVDRGERSIARLHCGHEFHLDCIGSAFNAKGAMQCPNCRKVEKGRWLYANGHRSSSDFDLDGWVTGDMYDFGNSDLPFGFQWCPFSGFTRYAAVFEDSESERRTYHRVGDHSAVSPHAHVCPYIAVNGGFRPMHGPSTSTSDAESTSFHRHPTSMDVQPTADINLSIFRGPEPHHDREQQFLSSIPLSGIADHSTPQFGGELPRYGSSQQRVRPIVGRPQTLFQRHASRAGSNLVTPMGSAALGETRGHAHSSRSHVYHPFVPSSMQSGPVPPTTRRVRPRALRITSFIAATSSQELGGSHGYSVSGTGVRSLPDGEGISRHVDRSYRWGRESFTPLPWIPVDGESHWWGPFNPNSNQSHQPGSFSWRPAERTSQNRMDNGYQRMPCPQMPPYI